MILIYTATTTYRLQYICQFIFKEQLGIPYSLTLNEEGFREYEGPRINYSEKQFEGKIFNIRNHPLLFEQQISQQSITISDSPKYKYFFPSKNSTFHFDIFAASFYLISRYEEYLPHVKDMYGRYAHENSIAFKEGFLDTPIINYWMVDFSQQLQAFFPSIAFKLPSFKILPTYDIDIAWSYQSKGILRNTGGFLKSPSLDRIKVLLRLSPDPYDAYDFLDQLHHDHHMHPVYFFHVAAQAGPYDKNIKRDSAAMINLIKRHTSKYSIGLHPSWKSNDDPAILNEEKGFMENLCGVSITNSRQHYIKFNLPDTYETLLSAGIINEYSMGYGSINGFRASVASSFYWYNLFTERQTALRIHPFCFMEANSFYEQKLTADQAFEELLQYYNKCKEVNGTMITIFHNNFLGEGKFKQWKNIYKKFITDIVNV